MDKATSLREPHWRASAVVPGLTSKWRKKRLTRPMPISGNSNPRPTPHGLRPEGRWARTDDHGGGAMFTDEMTTAQRIAAAKATMTKVLDHFLYLLELHENNAIIVYSPHLSDQIPTSYAANAFNVFQSGMHRLEIIRLCALWDKDEPEKECVPTVIKLFDNADALNALADETRNYWATREGHIISPAEDPELAREEQEILRHSNAQFGDEQAALAQHELKESIRAAALDVHPVAKSLFNKIARYAQNPGLRKPGIDDRRIKKSTRFKHEKMRKFSVINVSSL